MQYSVGNVSSFSKKLFRFLCLAAWFFCLPAPAEKPSDLTDAQLKAFLLRIEPAMSGAQEFWRELEENPEERARVGRLMKGDPDFRSAARIGNAYRQRLLTQFDRDYPPDSPYRGFAIDPNGTLGKAFQTFLRSHKAMTDRPLPWHTVLQNALRESAPVGWTVDRVMAEPGSSVESNFRRSVSRWELQSQLAKHHTEPDPKALAEWKANMVRQIDAARINNLERATRLALEEKEKVDFRGLAPRTGKKAKGAGTPPVLNRRNIDAVRFELAETRGEDNLASVWWRPKQPGLAEDLNYVPQAMLRLGLRVHDLLALGLSRGLTVKPPEVAIPYLKGGAYVGELPEQLLRISAKGSPEYVLGVPYDYLIALVNATSNKDLGYLDRIDKTTLFSQNYLAEAFFREGALLALRDFLKHQGKPEETVKDFTVRLEKWAQGEDRLATRLVENEVPPLPLPRGSVQHPAGDLVAGVEWFRYASDPYGWYARDLVAEKKKRPGFREVALATKGQKPRTPNDQTLRIDYTTDHGDGRFLGETKPEGELHRKLTNAVDKYFRIHPLLRGLVTWGGVTAAAFGYGGLVQALAPKPVPPPTPPVTVAVVQREEKPSGAPPVLTVKVPPAAPKEESKGNGSQPQSETRAAAERAAAAPPPPPPKVTVGIQPRPPHGLHPPKRGAGGQKAAYLRVSPGKRPLEDAPRILDMPFADDITPDHHFETLSMPPREGSASDFTLTTETSLKPTADGFVELYRFDGYRLDQLQLSDAKGRVIPSERIDDSGKRIPLYEVERIRETGLLVARLTPEAARHFDTRAIDLRVGYEKSIEERAERRDYAPFHNLNPTKLKALNQDLRQAGFLPMADALDRMVDSKVAQGKSISIADVDEEFRKGGVYSSIPQDHGDFGDPKNRFHEFTRYLKLEGKNKDKPHYECTGFNGCRDVYLRGAFEDHPEIIVEALSGYKQGNDLSTYVEDEGHRRSMIRTVDGRYRWIADATGSEDPGSAKPPPPPPSVKPEPKPEKPHVAQKEEPKRESKKEEPKKPEAKKDQPKTAKKTPAPGPDPIVPVPIEPVDMPGPDNWRRPKVVEERPEIKPREGSGDGKGGEASEPLADHVPLIWPEKLVTLRKELLDNYFLRTLPKAMIAGESSRPSLPSTKALLLARLLVEYSSGSPGMPLEQLRRELHRLFPGQEARGIQTVDDLHGFLRDVRDQEIAVMAKLQERVNNGQASVYAPFGNDALLEPIKNLFGYFSRTDWTPRKRPTIREVAMAEAERQHRRVEILHRLLTEFRADTAELPIGQLRAELSRLYPGRDVLKISKVDQLHRFLKDLAQEQARVLEALRARLNSGKVPADGILESIRALYTEIARTDWKPQPPEDSAAPKMKKGAPSTLGRVLGAIFRKPVRSETGLPPPSPEAIRQRRNAIRRKLLFRAQALGGISGGLGARSIDPEVNAEVWEEPPTPTREEQLRNRAQALSGLSGQPPALRFFDEDLEKKVPTPEEQRQYREQTLSGLSPGRKQARTVQSFSPPTEEERARFRREAREGLGGRKPSEAPRVALKPLSESDRLRIQWEARAGMEDSAGVQRRKGKVRERARAEELSRRAAARARAMQKAEEEVYQMLAEAAATPPLPPELERVKAQWRETKVAVQRAVAGHARPSVPKPAPAPKASPVHAELDDLVWGDFLEAVTKTPAPRARTRAAAPRGCPGLGKLE